MPAIITLSVWKLEKLNIALIKWPLIGFITLILGAISTWLIVNRFTLTKTEKAAALPLGGFSNLGALGSFTVLMVLGEQALAFVPLFKLMEEFFYYALLMPIIKKTSGSSQAGRVGWWRDPVLLATTSGLILGLVLNFFQVERLPIFSTINEWLVPLFTFSLLIAVGSGFQLSGIKKYLPITLLIAIVKQWCLPAVITAACWKTGMRGLELQTVFVLSSMPTAFIAVLPAQLFKLDLEIANTGWAVSSMIYLINLMMLSTIVRFIL